ncbi:MAG: Hsp20/alpha crystallin family protein [Pseudomonadota bacterium]|nr:MAG: heat-shock protein Hsp20 [Pseudomonadota bacterium]
MANLQRYNDPFGELFDDLFRGFFVRPVLNEGARPAPRLKVDVTEDDKQFRVLAELPGVKKEDIEVDIDGDQVTVSAEVKQEKEVAENGGRVLHSERYYGKLSRSFRLGHEIDAAACQAKYTDGILELVLPKKQSQSAKRITIQ